MTRNVSSIDIIDMTVVHKSNVTEKKLSFPFHAINLVFSLNRVSFFGFGP